METGPVAGAGSGPPEGAPAPHPPPAPRGAVPKFLAPGLEALKRIFPKETDEPRTRSGFVSDSRRELPYLLLAAGLALGVSLLWLWMVRVAPIPPGGDPSTWILTSYPFVGLPSTSGVQPLAYPPLAFPFVGVAVAVGGGPLLGGRLFMAAAIFFLGLATYALGRSLLERPALALLLEGLWLIEPDFQQLYYFGGYPNIFSLIFLVLAVAYLTRYLRSRRPSHLFLFWTFAAVCVLSHSLTGAVLAGVLVVFALLLLLAGRLPRTLVFSRAGALGVLLLGATVGAYYAGTALGGITHPSYLESTPQAIAKSQLLPTVLRPFYITSVPQWVLNSPVQLTSSQALDVMIAAGVGVLAVIVLLRWKRPGWLTTPWLTLAALVLPVFAIALVAYFLSIQLDYRRLPYFLYGPAIAALLYPVDLLLSNRMSRRPAPPDSSPGPPSGFGSRRLVRRYPWLRRWRRGVDPAIAGASVLLVLVVAQVVTVPSGANYEAFYTLYAHDSTFLTAVNAVAQSGIPGNLLASTPYVAHWPSTITNTRTTYVPSLANGNAYAAQHVADGETATVSLAGRYTVTNALVGATLPGTSAGQFNATPIYAAFSGNAYEEILQLVASSLAVGVTGGGPLVAVVPAGAAAPPVRATNGGQGFGLEFVEPGFLLNESVVAPAGTSSVLVSLTASANATSTNLLTSLSARLASLPFVSSNVTASGTGGFTWTSAGRAGALTTTGLVNPASALGTVTSLNSTPGTPPSVILRLNSTSTSGAPVLALTLLLSTAGASNFLTAIGPTLSTDVVWTNWTIRFVLFYAGQPVNPVFSAAYLEKEYGATVYATSGAWTVFLLPVSVVPLAR